MSRERSWNARRGYETPITRFKLSHFTYLLILMLAFAGLTATGIAPGWPNRGLILLQTIVTVSLSYVLVFRVAAYVTGADLRRLLAGGFVLLAILIVSYSYFMANYSVRLPDSHRLVLVSRHYTEEAQVYRAAHTGISDADLIRAYDADIQSVYTASSLTRVRVLQLLIWFLLLFVSSSILVVLTIPSKRQRDAAAMRVTKRSIK